MGTNKDYLLLHFIVFIWSFTAILGLLIQVHPIALVFFRTMIATGTMALLVYFIKQPFRVGTDFWPIVLTGLLIGIHWILFFGAARMANASVTLAGMATCSFWTSIIEPIMTRRKIKGHEIILGLVVIIGLYVVFKFEFRYLSGLLMAVASAMMAAIFTVLNGKFITKHSAYTITFYEMGGAFLCAVIAVLVMSFNGNLSITDFSPSSLDWAYLTILAIVCTVYPFSVSVELMKRLSAFAINLTVNLEPVYGIILAFLFFGNSERMTTGFYIGTAVILLAVLAYPILNKRLHQKPLELDNLR